MGHLVAHERAQRQMVTAISVLLQEAMNEAGAEYALWYEDAKAVLELQKKLKNEHENRIFNEKNGHAEKPVHLTPEIVKENYSDIMPSIGMGGMQLDPQTNASMNQYEAKSFGEEMSEEELARHFREKTQKKKDKIDISAKEPFKDMSIEEIESWEAKQNNSNDIYKVKARVANLARGAGASLTPVGEMMVNSFVHVVKDLYDFADTIPDKELKIKLIERVRKHENMPGSLIAAVNSSVTVKK